MTRGENSTGELWPDGEQIPEELCDRRQWICWADEGRGDGLTKVPKRPDGSGRNAKTNDNATWGSFEEAISTAMDNGWGVGFVFSTTDPYAGIDVDACLDGSGEPVEWLPPIDVLGEEVYVERSPSEEGLHVILKEAEVPNWWENQHDGGREVAVCEAGRYFTFTGNATQQGFGCLDGADALGRWLRAVWQQFNDSTPSERNAARSGDYESIEPDVYDLAFVPKRKFPRGKRRPHPVHGSSTGANFMVDEDGETWRCWRHDATGNALHLLGVKRGIVRCGQWTAGDLDKGTWRQIFEAAREVGLVKGDGRATGAKGGSTARGEPEASDGGSAPTPAAVKGLAGLGEDESLGSIGTNQRAHYAWRWIAEHNNVIAAQPDGELYAYESGVWDSMGDQRLRELGQLLLDAHYSKKTHSELCERARANAPVNRDALGTADGRVAVANGLLDLDERNIRPLRPEDNALVRLPVEYDPDANCEGWLAFLDDVVPERWHAAVQEYVGYCLCVGRLPIHRALMLVGEGANGKSTFLGTVRALLGEENVRAHTLQDLANEPYARADLFGAVANIHADLSPRSLGNGSTFKTLVGGDTVQARHLYENFFEFTPTAKLLFAANQVPEVDIEDTAFFRRWLVVEFPAFIPRDERDTELPERLTADEELSGILNWALDGRDRLLDQGRFTGEGDPVEKRSRWLSWGDTVTTFIEECVDVDGDNDQRVTSGDVYDVYVAYCEGLGEDPASQQKLTNKLKSAGANYGKHRIDGSVQRGFRGVVFTDEAPDVTLESQTEEPDVAGSDGEQQQLSQNRVVQVVREAVREADEVDGYAGARPDEVLERAEEAGIDRGRAEYQIDCMLERGELLELDHGWLRLT